MVVDIDKGCHLGRKHFDLVFARIDCGYRFGQSRAMLPVFPCCNIVDAVSVQNTEQSMRKHTLPRLQEANCFHLLCIAEHM